MAPETTTRSPTGHRRRGSQKDPKLACAKPRPMKLSDLKHNYDQKDPKAPEILLVIVSISEAFHSQYLRIVSIFLFPPKGPERPQRYFWS